MRMYVALEKDAKAPWDPVAHKRMDIVPHGIAVRHAQNGMRIVTISYQSGGGVDDIRQYRRAFLTGVSEGQTVLIGAGQPSAPNYALAGAPGQVSILCRRWDWLQLQRNLMAGVISDPYAYVHELRPAADLDDVTTILEASTSQLEWTYDGRPMLASIFGQPEKLRVFGEGEYRLDNLTPETEQDDPPPSAIRLDLFLEATQGNYIDQDVGLMIRDALQAEMEKWMREDPDPSDPAFINPVAFATFTPSVVTDGWPKALDTLGEFFVRESSIELYTGPGAPGKPTTDGPTITVDQDTQSFKDRMAGKTSKKKAAGSGGKPRDPKDPTTWSQDNDDGTQTVMIESTTFANAKLRLLGTGSRQRREQVTMILAYGGQDLVADNAPPTFLSYTVSDLTQDEVTAEWREGDYLYGDQCQVGGQTFQCILDHYATGSFWGSFVEQDPDLDTYGQDRWISTPYNKSPLGRWDLDKFATTAFGTRCVAWCARRIVAEMGGRTKKVRFTFTVPFKAALGLDPSYTVRILNRRLKGGQAEGKVEDIVWAWSSDTKDSSATITIACCIGSGDGAAPDPGDGYEGTDTGTGAGMTVRYQVAPYVVEEIAPMGAITVHADLFAWAQRHLVLNPTKNIKGVSYTVGDPIADFMEHTAPSVLSADFAPPTPSTGKVQPVTVFMQPWRGPRQVEL